MKQDYGVIVVGAGHAGCEAAMASSRMGVDTLLITLDMNKIAQMSCNPAMGGIAKGQIVREIDALGGMAGIITDASSIQFRMLNRSKGPAMWSPRSQCDRMVFSANWRHCLENAPHLMMWQDEVVDLLFDNDGSVIGVKTAMGAVFTCPAVVITAGTFLNGLMHCGELRWPGGRISEPAANSLSSKLTARGLRLNRMKTGTPVRIDGRSIDFSQTQIQYGDDTAEQFSYMPFQGKKLKQRPCFIAHTNEKTHEILRRALDRSPLFNGQIQSIGPRYCPSIETKIHTFADKSSHQLFIEPEGENTQEFYLNGFSSSMPMDIQIKALETIPAFRNILIYRPGYAIEYDYFDPTQLNPTLESKLVSGLFMAGQVNGTTGYEEAGGQGLIAGVNAALKARGENPDFILARDQAYIGVLIDDLVTKGVDEPYRMFTSRAEHRILLRQDNADQRLTPIAAKYGLVDNTRVERLEKKVALIEDLAILLKETKFKTEIINPLLESKGSSPVKESVSASSLISRPQLNIHDLIVYSSTLKEKLDFIPEDYLNEVLESSEINIKYSGYIEREMETAKKLRRLENVRIPETMDFLSLNSISTEARQKLNTIQPKTIGQASRIPGVSPNDINVLLLLLGR